MSNLSCTDGRAMHMWVKRKDGFPGANLHGNSNICLALFTISYHLPSGTSEKEVLQIFSRVL